MDEMNVHFPLNVKKSTVSDEDTASPVQTVADKDLSNPFMAVTLSKSEKEESSSFSQNRRRLPLSFTQNLKQKTKDIEFLNTKTVEKLLKQKQEQDKYMIKDPSPIPSQKSSQKNSEENLETMQFAQDPNDDDSGMSFDSIALHNLDT